MITYACSEERFMHDVRDHKLTVVRADGVDRHLKFRRPGGSEYWFEIVTWRGTLCIHGDCGTYVFSRLEDMFDFFRNSGSRINPSYWSEKVQASDRDGIKRFEWDKFIEDVQDDFDQAWESDDVENSAKRNECWRAIEDELSNCEPDVYGAAQFIRDFEHDGFRFADWERQSEQYTFRFIWNCRAIVWAIRKYDDHVAALDN